MEYRRFLSTELEARKRKNSHYSLRAFSRDLGISVSRLSEVLSGEDLSVRSAEQIADKLRLNDDMKKLFIESVRASYGKSAAGKLSSSVVAVKTTQNTTQPRIEK